MANFRNPSEDANKENTPHNHTEDQEIKKELALNPNTPAETLKELGATYPAEFVAKSLLDLLSLVNPSLYVKMPTKTLITLLSIEEFAKTMVLKILSNLNFHNKKDNLMTNLLSKKSLWNPWGESDAQKRQVYINGAYIDVANLEGAYLDGVNLEGAYLKGAYLSSAYLDEANLSGANLNEANLSVAYLRKANLKGAYLRKANLKGAYLRKANLEKANLDGANLDGANLDGANLRGANLRGANLRGANLDGANLDGANLLGANFLGANLKGAKINTKSII